MCCWLGFLLPHFWAPNGDDASCLAGSGCQSQASGWVGTAKGGISLSVGPSLLLCFICSSHSQQRPLYHASPRILNSILFESSQRNHLHSETFLSLPNPNQQNVLATSPLSLPLSYTWSPSLCPFLIDLYIQREPGLVLSEWMDAKMNQCIHSCWIYSPVGFSLSNLIMVLAEFMNKLYVYTMEYYSETNKRTNS